jgi:membrane-associated phospholipid phosphatase
MNAKPGRGVRLLIAVVAVGLVIGLFSVSLRGMSAPPDTMIGSAWGRYGSRILLLGVSLFAWFWTQALIGSRPLPPGVAIGDILHRVTAPLHAYLSARPRAADRVLIVSSLFIDLFGLALFASVFLGGSLAPFAALLLVFAFRQACQGLCALQPPPDMIWRNPGFPSLLVTYGVSTDFFISGHTAVAVLGAIVAAQYLPWYVGLGAGVIAFLEAATVIVLRAHYTMDVLGAVAAAWCAHDIAVRLLGG